MRNEICYDDEHLRIVRILDQPRAQLLPKKREGISTLTHNELNEIRLTVVRGILGTFEHCHDIKEISSFSGTNWEYFLLNCLFIGSFSRDVYYISFHPGSLLQLYRAEARLEREVHGANDS